LLPEAARWDPLLRPPPIVRVIFNALARQIGHGHTRCQGVDADVVLREIHRHHPRHGDDAAFGRGIGSHIGNGEGGMDTGNIDD